jgi:hypothetical protein
VAGVFLRVLAAQAEPLEEQGLVLHPDGVKFIRIDERLHDVDLKRVLPKRILADLSLRPEILDAGHEQAMQRSGFVVTNEVGLPLYDLVDPTVCVASGGLPRLHPPHRSVFFALSHPAGPSGEVGQYRQDETADGRGRLAELLRG